MAAVSADLLRCGEMEWKCPRANNEGVALQWPHKRATFWEVSHLPVCFREGAAEEFVECHRLPFGNCVGGSFYLTGEVSGLRGRNLKLLPLIALQFF